MLSSDCPNFYDYLDYIMNRYWDVVYTWRLHIVISSMTGGGGGGGVGIPHLALTAERAWLNSFANETCRSYSSPSSWSRAAGIAFKVVKMR